MNTSIYDVTHDTRLSDIADICSGHPFRGSIEPDINGDVHVVQVRNTKATGEIVQDEVITTTLTSKKQPDWLKTGDILFVAKGAKHYYLLPSTLLYVLPIADGYFKPPENNKYLYDGNTDRNA